MEIERSRYDDRDIIGYWFRLNKWSKFFLPLLSGGGVDLFRVRLFRDGAVYARDKAKAKRDAKRVRGSALHWMKSVTGRNGRKCPSAGQAGCDVDQRL